MPDQALQPGRFISGQDDQQKTREPLSLQAKICTIYLVLMCTAFLLFFYPGIGYRNISGAKRNAFYVLTGCYLIALLMTSKSKEELALLKERIKRSSVVLWALLVYLLVTIVSGLLSPHGLEVWVGHSRNEGVLTQFLYVSVFTTLLLFAKPKRWILYLLGATIIGMTVIAVLQVIGGNPLGIYPSGRSYVRTNGRFLTTIGNVDFTSGLLCVLIPIFAVALIRGEGWTRLLMILPLSAALYLLLQIDVLGGYVGVAIGSAIALPFVLRFPAKATVWYFVLLVLAGAAGVAGLYFYDVGSGMFHEIHEILHGNIDDLYGSGRIYIWRQVLERIPKRFWIGYGPDTMRLEMLSPFQRFDPETQKWVTARIDVAHNEYLNILFHQGIFALAAYLTAAIGAVVHFFRYAKRNTAVAMFGSGIVCYLVQAFFGIAQPITCPSFWISLGLMEAAVLAERFDPSDLRLPVRSKPHKSVGRFERVPEQTASE